MQRLTSLIPMGLILIVVLAPPSSSRADAAPEERGITVETVLEHDRARETRVFGLGRARISHPQRLSGSLGAMVVRQPIDYDCATVCDLRGLVIQLEPGIAGGQVSVGWALVVGEKKRRDFFLADVYMGFGIKGALLRTWGDTSLEPSGQTFLGVEGAFTVTRVNFSVGVFRHVSSGPTDHEWLATAGIGWGF